MAVLELGERLPELVVNVRQRSAQAWVLSLTDKATNDPVTIVGRVVLEVDGKPLWYGAVNGAAVSWDLTAAETDLRLGRHAAALVRLYGTDGREVWARGRVDVR